jgi:hypothetical protein
MDVACFGGVKIVATQQIELAKQTLKATMTIDFFLEEASEGVEIRIYVFAGTRLGIKQLKLAAFNPV